MKKLIANMLPHLGEWRPKSRGRKGFTLIEAILVITISAIMVSGTGILWVSVQEQLAINFQIREAEEFGLAYVNQFVRRVRNGYDVEILRVTAPSSARLTYVIPVDVYAAHDVVEDDVEFQFKFDRRLGLPMIERNNRRYELFQDERGQGGGYVPWPPDNPDRRDNFWTPQTSFEIRRLERNDSSIPEDFRDHFLEMRFTIMYRRDPTLPGQRPFYKELDFNGSAYTVNVLWPSTDYNSDN